MSELPLSENRRVLLVDDDRSVHDNFARILSSSAEPAGSARLDAAKIALFGEQVVTGPPIDFEITSASQGEEAKKLVAESVTANRPFAMAFVDERMPPGWNGLETIRAIWEQDARVQVVLCSANSDVPLRAMARELRRTDKLLALKKPFDDDEAYQLALTLTTKWNLEQEMMARLIKTERQLNSLKEATGTAHNEFLAETADAINGPLDDVVHVIELLDGTQLNSQQRSFLEVAKAASANLRAVSEGVQGFCRVDKAA